MNDNKQENIANSIQPDILALVEAAKVVSAKINRFTPKDPKISEIQRTVLRRLDAIEADAIIFAIAFMAVAMEVKDGAE